MPTLNVITSSSQRCLIEALADKMRSKPLPPLEHEHIVVLSNGMARWISMELAGCLGVSAGLEFSFPNDLLDRSFTSILPDAQSSFSFTTTSLTWRIASRLQGLAHQTGFEQIAAYLGNNQDDRRLLQMSRSIAGCFDQYTIFRPEMICAWDKGKGTDWQAQLWRTINSDAPGRHRAALLESLGRYIAEGARPVTHLPQRISLFGISYLPPFHLEALRLLSNYCEVTCYLLNPCGQYWGTIISEKQKALLALQHDYPVDAEEYYETGNPLLSSLGTLGQEFFETMLDYGFAVEELDNATGQTTIIEDTCTHSALSAVQNDILNLFDHSTTDSTKVKVSANDSSLRIHSCHGCLREMEILYDNLLALFDELTDLEPRHIVVMIPDIESYTPYISSVFGNRSTGRMQIPYTIADRSIRRESSFVDAFLKFMGIATGRFSLHEILELLEMPSILSRFDMDNDEFGCIKSWLTACNVRWGVDADHRRELGFSEYDDFSWQAGLDRLLLGYAIAPDDFETFGSILPYDSGSGNRLEALGKLMEFFSVLRKLGQLMKFSHTPAAWADLLTSAIAQLQLPEENDTTGPITVIKAINSLRDASSKFGFIQPITLNCVRDYLAETVASSGSGYGFMGGAVTFCAMLPMRSIPMRVVWLAGMNDGSFPRTEKPPGFSLMNGKRRRGDRSLRDEDRYLFLEALMAAEDRFCISYTGQSDRDNSIVPPSVLVSELSDYIAKSLVVQDSNSPPTILIRHRLQGFSALYFNNTDPAHLFSYDRETCQALENRRLAGCSGREFIKEPLLLDTGAVRHIELSMLTRFLANPAAAFLEQRLKVVPFNPSETQNDSEPFALDALTDYSLSQELVSQIIKGAAYDNCLDAARSRALLPPLATGNVAFNNVWEKSRQFAAALEPHLGTPLETLPVTFIHGNLHLHATLANCRSNTLCRWRCARMKGRDILSIWIEHLLLNIAKADGYPLNSTLVASDTTRLLPPLDNAAEFLADLLNIYDEGMQRPLRFFPETSWAFLNGGRTNAETIWRGDRQRGFYGESGNPSVALCFGNEEPWGEELALLAERIYGPLVALLNQ